MTTTMQRRQLLAAGLATALPWSARAQAQDLGTVSVVSGFPAGGMGDQIGRPLLERLRGRYAGALLMENRAGAGGRIAVDYVRRAAPDGRTLLQIPGSVLSLYPHIYSKLPYDPLADFVPVSPLCGYTYAFTAGPGLPAHITSVAEYVRWARDKPSGAVYGVPAAGSALHFAGMMLQRAAKFNFNSIPYRGGAPLLQDLLGGQVPVSFNVLGEVLPAIRAGKLRALAVTSARRSVFLPEAPTLIEQGFASSALHEWLGWLLPAKAPADLVNHLNGLVREALASAEMKEVLAKNALEPELMSPAEFAATLKADLARWAPIVKATGFKADE